MPLELQNTLSEIFAQLRSLAERLTRLEARSEIHATVPQLLDAVGQIKVILASQESEIGSIKELRQHVTEIERTVDHIQQAIEHAKSADMSDALADLTRQIKEVTDSLETAKKGGVLGLVENLSTAQKFLAAVVGIGAAVGSILYGWYEYADPFFKALAAEVAKHGSH